MPRKKVQPRRQILGNPVMVTRSCLAFDDAQWKELGDEYDSVELQAGPCFLLKKGQVGLAVSTKGSKVLVLIRGRLLLISRSDISPCNAAA